jgi:hypothetical protein
MMGEAKRRQATGHKVTTGTDAVDFRVPDGMVAITLDIAGCAPSTATPTAQRAHCPVSQLPPWRRLPLSFQLVSWRGALGSVLIHDR